MTNAESDQGRVSELRIGDAERNAAVAALGDHMSTGRLDLEEYGNRSATASAARTVGELQSLFADLPAPHPPLPSVAAPLARPAAGSYVQNVAASNLPTQADERSKAQKFVAAASASSAIIALILFFTVGGWWWFLLIPLISSVAGSVWGDSWKSPGRG